LNLAAGETISMLAAAVALSSRATCPQPANSLAETVNAYQPQIWQSHCRPMQQDIKSMGRSVPVDGFFTQPIKLSRKRMKWSVKFNSATPPVSTGTNL
jgi:hypothetical protein